MKRQPASASIINISKFFLPIVIVLTIMGDAWHPIPYFFAALLGLAVSLYWLFLYRNKKIAWCIYIAEVAVVLVIFFPLLWHPVVPAQTLTPDQTPSKKTDKNPNLTPSETPTDGKPATSPQDNSR